MPRCTTVVCCFLAVFAVLPPCFATDASECRRLADQAVARGEYAQAASYYRQEAEVYRARGDRNAAEIESLKAERWSIELDLYCDVPPARADLLPLYTGAKYEPVYGCYLGACVTYDDRLAEGARSPEGALAALIGKPLAVAYDYGWYGDDFPSGWAWELRQSGIAPQIAWEPRDLRKVQDDAYLQDWARAAASCGGPIFLRFAGEMNGDWTPYHGDPELYREKFRLVHDVMARLAPNVAMIWCVNTVPEGNMDRYYPGDQYVDWVGVNFYSVRYHDNNPDQPCAWEPPTALLQYVYSKYAARKPIAICEYGATHEDTVEKGAQRADFAVAKLQQLFSALPRQFRRVKMIDIFDCNNLTCRYSGRPFNDYCLTDNSLVTAGFRAAVAPDYFLSHAVIGGAQSALPTHVQALRPGAVLSGVAALTAWIKTWELQPSATYEVDGKPVATVAGPGVYRYDLDTATLAPGPHTLGLVARDECGEEAGRKEIAVTVVR
jgi:hypothetical protein